MNKIIISTVLVMLFSSTTFAQTSDLALDSHRFVNNASAVSHVNSAAHEQSSASVQKVSAKPFSAMDEHEKAIVAHSFMNNSNAYSHQQMIEKHQAMKEGV